MNTTNTEMVNDIKYDIQMDVVLLKIIHLHNLLDKVYKTCVNHFLK